VIKGEPLALIANGGKNLRIYSPLSGEIVTGNPIVESNPEAVKNDPYKTGWVYSVLPYDWRGDTNSLLFGEESSTWITKEFDRFKDFLAVSFGKYSPEPSVAVFQEGGELKQNPLEGLTIEIWDDFQHEFLESI
jgi:hypothetical protein